MLTVISVYLSPKCLRELRRWATEVRAEVVSSNVQAGKFNSLEGGRLTFHVRERRANGQLVGILLDDQRDPKEQTTILAERGDIVTGDQGTYLVLQEGTVQRREKGKRDPALVKFDQYAFDLSRLSAAPANIRYSVQERYLWELMYPPAGDSLYKDQPGSFTTEIHNRLTAPLYPLAFVVLTFAYLGAPRTTRQSRTMSLISVVSVVGLVRGAGFVGTLSGSKDAYSFAVPYIALLGAFGFGFWGIARGLIIEPPAFFSNFYTWVTESVSSKKPVATGQTP
jgi:lipopolysaccharide export system permease protein